MQLITYVKVFGAFIIILDMIVAVGDYLRKHLYKHLFIVKLCNYFNI